MFRLIDRSSGNSPRLTPISRRLIFVTAVAFFFLSGVLFSAAYFTFFLVDPSVIEATLPSLGTQTTAVTISIDPSYTDYYDFGGEAPYAINRSTPCNAYDSDGFCVEYVPDLCPYLAITPDNEEATEVGFEENLADSYTPAVGELNHPIDEADHWNVAMTSPCFEGECPAGYDASRFGDPLPQSVKGQTFRCDLTVTSRDIIISQRFFKTPIARAANPNIIQLSAVFSGEITTPPAKEPVIIVPGILGSELKDTAGNLYWANLSAMAENTDGDQFLTDALDLDSTGQPLRSSIVVGEVIKKIELLNVRTVADIFNGLTLDLQDHGYSSSTLFTFPYDWRLNIDSNRAALNQKITDIKNKTGASKVNIVAHSMGGLVTKDYLDQYGTSSIDKVIFVGTPHLGAPKAAKILIAGDQFSIPWLNPLRMKEIGLGSPATYELMPSPQYMNDFGGYLWPARYSAPVQYSATQTFLQIFEGASRNIFNQADSFFDKNLQNIDLSGISTYNIAGCKRGTQAGYLMDSANSEIALTNYVSGDRTVPLGSADFISLEPARKFYVRNVDHVDLPSVPGVSDLIVGILTNTSTTLASNVSNQKTPFCALTGKELGWHSPVEIHIYDELGNHTGPTSTEAIEYNVPGIDYDVMGHNKFVFLPTDSGHTYQVVTKALSSGTFDFSITQNTDGAQTQGIVFNDVAITASSTATQTITDTSDDTSLQLDRLGDNQFSPVSADAVLNPGELGDMLPPVTTISASGTQGAPGAYRSDIDITLNASDTQSGILFTKYALNNSSIFLNYVSPFSVTGEGTTTIQYYSVDRAGNDEAVQTSQLLIDKTAPEFTIAFDSSSTMYAIGATDNFDSNPVIACTASDCLATDQAGNSAKLVFKTKDSKNQHTIKLISVSYNSSTPGVFPDNILRVTYKEKNDEMKDFDHTWNIKKQERATINYEKKKDRSIVTIKEWKHLRDKEIIPGLKVIQLITRQGLIEADIK